MKKYMALAIATLTLGIYLKPRLARGSHMQHISLTLHADSFVSGDTIPAQFTCQGENSSPALHWQTNA